MRKIENSSEYGFCRSKNVCQVDCHLNAITNLGRSQIRIQALSIFEYYGHKSTKFFFFVHFGFKLIRKVSLIFTARYSSLVVREIWNTVAWHFKISRPTYFLSRVFQSVTHL